MCGGEETSEYPVDVERRLPSILRYRGIERRFLTAGLYRGMGRRLIVASQRLDAQTQKHKDTSSSLRLGFKRRAEPRRPQRLRGGDKLAIRPMAIRIEMEKTEEKRDNSQCFGISDFVDRRTGETVDTIV